MSHKNNILRRQSINLQKKWERRRYLVPQPEEIQHRKFSMRSVTHTHTTTATSWRLTERTHSSDCSVPWRNAIMPAVCGRHYCEGNPSLQALWWFMLSAARRPLRHAADLLNNWEWKRTRMKCFDGNEVIEEQPFRWFYIVTKD